MPAHPSGKRRLDGNYFTSNDWRPAFIMSGHVLP